MRGDTGIVLSSMPTHGGDVSRCHCGGWLWFSLDSIGRTIENCDGCAYKGPQRTQSFKTPTWARKAGYQVFSATCKECHQAFTYTRRNLGQTKGVAPDTCSDCKRLIRANKGRPRRRGFPIALQLGKNDPNRAA